jgi:Fe-S cluster assembly iron-binding protein IscA
MEEKEVLVEVSEQALDELRVVMKEEKHRGKALRLMVAGFG